MHTQLQFHGYHHCWENSIKDFLDAIEKRWDKLYDNENYTWQQGSRYLAEYKILHLRGRALVFAEGLFVFVQSRFQDLPLMLLQEFDVVRKQVYLYCNQDPQESPAQFPNEYTHELILPSALTIEKFTQYLDRLMEKKAGCEYSKMRLEDLIRSLCIDQYELKKAVLDCWMAEIAQIAEIKVKKSNDPVVTTTIDIKQLESKMNALIATADQKTRVLLSDFFVLRNVCHMICTIARVGKERKSAEDKMKLNLKKTEQPLIDQAEGELVQLKKEVDIESKEILEERDGLAEESKSRLEKGIVERFCVLCCPLNHVNRFLICCVKLVEGWRDVFVANNICFVGKMHRLGIGKRTKTLLTGRERDRRSLERCLQGRFVCFFSFVGGA